MLFNSYEFIFIFLPLCLILFFTASRFSKSLAVFTLTACSLLFYGWRNAYFIPLLIASVCANYFISKRINGRRSWLITGLVVNFAVLGVCKCTGILPLGISFFTFTQVAYLVNVFRGTAKPEGFMNYAEYVTFFGYITSGSIADYRDMMPQFRSAGRADYGMIAQGITLFALGLFKKVYIADGIAPTVNGLFSQSELLTFFEAWAAALAYSMQLYFDFSGYSDMAIAVGLMFGLRLPENFNSPYKSTSIIEFWRRWHMSLGAWIRDYIYIPLGGSREGDFRRTRNVIIAMLFTGLWHGLGWKFVFWGLVHGVMLAVNHQWRKLGVKIPALLAWGLTFACVVVCWVIFRADSIVEAMNILAAMMGSNGVVFPLRLSRYLGSLEPFGVSFGGIAGSGKAKILPVMLLALVCLNKREIMSSFKPVKLWLVAVMILLIMSFSKFSGISDFLYFQF